MQVTRCPLSCSRFIRIMTHPSCRPNCHSNTINSKIDSSRGIHIIHTNTRTHTHTHKSPCRSSLSLSPRPPYLLALLHVADALSQSTLQFWGNIRCSEDRLRHNIKHGNVKVKQIEQHYYSANKCTSLPDSFVPACLPLSSV